MTEFRGSDDGCPGATALPFRPSSPLWARGVAGVRVQGTGGAPSARAGRVPAGVHHCTCPTICHWSAEPWNLVPRPPTAPLPGPQGPGTAGGFTGSRPATRDPRPKIPQRAGPPHPGLAAGHAWGTIAAGNLGREAGRLEGWKAGKLGGWEAGRPKTSCISERSSVSCPPPPDAGVELCRSPLRPTLSCRWGPRVGRLGRGTRNQKPVDRGQGQGRTGAALSMGLSRGSRYRPFCPLYSDPRIPEPPAPQGA